MLAKILENVLIEERIDHFFIAISIIFPVISLLTIGILACLHQPLNRVRSIIFAEASIPLIGVLWFVYKAIFKHYGLDSLIGLGVNLLLFVTLGSIIGLLTRYYSNRKKRGLNAN